MKIFIYSIFLAVISILCSIGLTFIIYSFFGSYLSSNSIKTIFVDNDISEVIPRIISLNVYN